MEAASNRDVIEKGCDRHALASLLMSALTVVGFTGAAIAAVPGGTTTLPTDEQLIADPAASWEAFLQHGDANAYGAYAVLSSVGYHADGVDAAACAVHASELDAAVRMAPVSIAVRRAAMLCAEATGRDDTAEVEMAVLAALSRHAWSQVSGLNAARPIRVLAASDAYAWLHASGLEFRYDYYGSHRPERYLPMTVADMVMLGRSPHQSTFARNSATDHRIAATALRQVGARHLADRIFAGLSGGEKQRVMIARALAQQPTHLMLDEPTNHLDIRFQHELLAIVRGLAVTTVVVLHDINLAARYCDDVLVLDRGSVAAHGPCADVLTPALLQEIYGVGVERIETSRGPQFLFHPLEQSSAPPTRSALEAACR